MTTPTQGEHAQTEASHAIAQLRHLYHNMVGGGVRDAGEAKTIAAGLLSPAIAALETAIAQPAAPQGVAYAELPEFEELDDDLIDLACSTGALYRVDFRRAWEVMREGLRASHGQAPAGAAVVDQNPQNVSDKEACVTPVIDKTATTAQAAPAAGAVAEPSVRKVFLVATGDEHEGEATYTRYDDAPPPLCDSECLYTAAPTPAAHAVDNVGAWAVRVERLLCEKLGRPWSAEGISINSMIDELAARADSQTALAVKPACWIPPEYEGEYHRPGESITAYREPMEGWEPVYRAARAPADSVLEDAARSEREHICAAIKAEDDYCVDQGDYMLDSDDCIKIVRGEWVRPDFSVDAARKQGAKHD